MRIKVKTLLFITALTAAAVYGGVNGWAWYKDRRLKEYLVQKTDEIYNSLSLEEQLGQLFMIALPGKSFSDKAAAELKAVKPGSVIYFGYNFDLPYIQSALHPKEYTADVEAVNAAAEKLAGYNRDLQSFAVSNYRVPLLLTTDQENGRVHRIQAKVTQFPSAMAIGQTGSALFAENAGFISGYELGRLGINFTLAPVVDINNNPSNPVINTRSFGSDLKTVNMMSVAYMRGLNSAGNIAAVKHFPGHGDTNKDSHVDLPVINKSLAELEALELIPFKESISQGADVVMTAHILLPRVDPDNVATMSPVFLKEILRKKLKYNGIIISDALEMEGVAKRNPGENMGERALNAGVDIFLFTSWGERVKKVYDYLLAGLKSGRISRERIAESCKRILKLKLKSGIFHSNRSSFVRADDRLGEYLAIKQKNIDNHYKQLTTQSLNYTTRGNWNYRIALHAVRGLYKPVDGLPVQLYDTLVFYSTPAVREAAVRHRIPAEQLRSIGSLSAAAVKGAKVVVVEVNRSGELARYNSFVKELAAQKGWPVNGIRVKNSGTRLIALYSGSPFEKIMVPEVGGVAATFSPTRVSLQAGFDRLVTAALNKDNDKIRMQHIEDERLPELVQQIPAARLVLPFNR